MDVLGFSPDPLALDAEKIELLCDIQEILDDLTPEELLQKYKKGQQEHNEDLRFIDCDKELRDEVIDAFWYRRIRIYQKHLATN